MLNTILIILGSLFGVMILAGLYGQTHRRTDAFVEHLDAQTHLLDEQASHVNQTAQAEKANLEATIKAYEKQGVNKFRTEIARLGGDLKKVEEQLGSKLKAVPLEEHEELKRLFGLANNSGPATSTGCIGSSEGTAYVGQPSPGSGIPA